MRIIASPNSISIRPQSKRFKAPSPNTTSSILTSIFISKRRSRTAALCCGSSKHRRRQTSFAAAGAEAARIDTIYFDDGRRLAVRAEGDIPDPADPDAFSTSLEGRWLGRYGLPQVSLNLEEWPLTDKGRAAQASYDQTQNPQVDCIPVASPSLMLYSNIFEVNLADDSVDILFEWLDVERTIWLDGRDHPPADELFHQGHAIGRFEGRTLVVDTANFSEHGVGNAFEVPSGTGKHLIERLTLSEDGRRVTYEFELTDPEYLTESVRGDVIWDYRPDLEPQRIECNRDVARRFLERRMREE
jgi:hypothetical protein